MRIPHFVKILEKKKPKKNKKKNKAEKNQKQILEKILKKLKFGSKIFFFWSKKVYASPKMCLFLVQNMFSGFKMTIPDPKHL